MTSRSKPHPPAPPSISGALLRWYARHARRLPWRGRKDPYAVWVSEIMLQQTRVEAVVPYYRRWMRRFPRLVDLAAATADEVLQAWEGLGYYRRALNLLKAAQLLVGRGDGRLPRTAVELEKLPGVGRYTAAAIAALTFGQDEIALDGNLQRVLSRLLDLRVDPRTRPGERRIRAYARTLLPRGKAAAFNQALMDLGAMVCQPRGPHCAACPLLSGCLAFARGTQDSRPVRKRRAQIPHWIVGAAVLQRKGSVLIARRPEGSLLGGLWEFPGGKREPGETLSACIRRELKEEIGISVRVGPTLGVFRHAYSHYRVTVHAFACTPAGGRLRAREHSAVRWVRPETLAEFPMGKVDRAIAATLTSCETSTAGGGERRRTRGAIRNGR